MTKFIDRTKEVKEVKEVETIFKTLVGEDGRGYDSTSGAREWDNVEFIRSDENYGDVFFAWNANPKQFNLYFGTRGTEFDDPKNTKFIDNTVKELKAFNETVFNVFLSNSGIEQANVTPVTYDTVEYIGSNKDLGDEFHVYYNGEVDHLIYFGIKGDEF